MVMVIQLFENTKSISQKEKARKTSVRYLTILTFRIASQYAPPGTLVHEMVGWPTIDMSFSHSFLFLGQIGKFCLKDWTSYLCDY